MTTKSHSGKLVAIVLVAIIGAAAGFGYFKQASVMSESEAKTTNGPSQAQLAALSVKPNDIIIGDANALVTMVEYASLSCSHCAAFHTDVLPTLEKEFITPGKMKVVMRHFPLNAPAAKGSMIVECAGQNGLNRAGFLKALFEMQAKWAFDENFEQNLKQIARVGGLDSATLDSCLSDKSLEDKIIQSRKEGEEVLKIDGTPSFFIDGVRYDGPRDVSGFRDAIGKAMKADADALKPAADIAPAKEDTAPAKPEASKPAQKAAAKPVEEAPEDTEE